MAPSRPSDGSSKRESDTSITTDLNVSSSSSSGDSGVNVVTGIAKRDPSPPSEVLAPPIRRNVGLHIEATLSHGDPDDFDLKVLREVLRRSGFMDRLKITSEQPSAVHIWGNAHCISDALRIRERKNDREFDVQGLKGTLTVTHLQERVDLTFEENTSRQYDRTLGQLKHHGFTKEYCSLLSGRDGDQMDYMRIMINPPESEPPKFKYPHDSKVAKFWQENCGMEFPKLVAKFGNTAKLVKECEMDDFYDHLFTGIFDHGYDIIPPANLCRKEGEYLTNSLSGYYIQSGPGRGAIMIAEYVPGSFVKADKGKPQTPIHPLNGAISAKAYIDTQDRLRYYSTIGALHGFAAVSWIYGMTVYREKVFFSRMNVDSGDFEVLGSHRRFQAAGFLAPNWRKLWKPVLSDEGYLLFQTVVNAMDDMVAARP